MNNRAIIPGDRPLGPAYNPHYFKYERAHKGAASFHYKEDFVYQLLHQLTMEQLKGSKLGTIYERINAHITPRVLTPEETKKIYDRIRARRAYLRKHLPEVEGGQQEGPPLVIANNNINHAAPALEEHKDGVADGAHSPDR